MDATYTADPPHQPTAATRESMVDRGGSAARTELEESPEAHQWMAKVLRRHGWTLFPPGVVQAATNAPAAPYCATHKCHHVLGDNCALGG